jgi:CTP synthase
LTALQEAGLVVSGLYTERDLVDVAELANHPFMLGSQFHPEFKSRPLVPHPLFRDFMEAVCGRAMGRAEPMPAQTESLPEKATAA